MAADHGDRLALPEQVQAVSRRCGFSSALGEKLDISRVTAVEQVPEFLVIEPAAATVVAVRRSIGVVGHGEGGDVLNAEGKQTALWDTRSALAGSPAGSVG